MPFRIAARHPDKGPDNAWHQVGGLYESAGEAQADIDQVYEAARPQSLAVDERVRADAVSMTSERAAAGYEMQVEELVPDGTGKDDNGNEVVVTHKWEAVS